MAAWKYIKGSETDFLGAPEWATVRIGGESFSTQYWGEKFEHGSKCLSCNGGEHLKMYGIYDCGEIIAQRERVTSINDDRLAQDVNALITERGNRYGKFKDGAEIMRDLKQVMQQTEGWSRCTPSQKEALDMIQHKIGRILNGDPTYDDSWKDIAGYATLIVEELNGVSK